jgi:arginyl-tRNA--protein-N-Asp/Glu arginylyltransferase
MTGCPSDIFEKKSLPPPTVMLPLTSDQHLVKRSVDVICFELKKSSAQPSDFFHPSCSESTCKLLTLLNQSIMILESPANISLETFNLFAKYKMHHKAKVPL